ncbi:MAG: PQQ-dependent sugar dehydrogenase, partial [Gammaproteobacteria bacterium]|nr:PQQ-dependent sugar dehydrogenase [Gammaproteobacteria bacterium]NNL43784.1 PQQ-dependent sugar dehydrogenase [Woeseiaceae bacterium]
MTSNRLFATALSVLLVLSTAGNAQDSLPFNAAPVTSFDEPWALAFLPDGRMLVTEKKGNLFIVSQNGQKSRPVAGLPDVDYGGQGGLGDIAVHPDFADNGLVYLSYAERGTGKTRGGAVTRAVLNLTERGGYLSDA